MCLVVLRIAEKWRQKGRSAHEGIEGSRGEGMDMLFGVFVRLGIEFVRTRTCSKRALRSK